MFLKKLERADDRYKEIEQMITLPEVVSDNARYSALMKEYKSLTPVIEKYREYMISQKEMRDADEMRRDGDLDTELRELAEEEYKIHRENLEALTEEHA